MNRRGFLGACIAACAAPAIVRADSLMRIIPRDLAVLADYEEGTFVPALLPWQEITREAMRIAHEQGGFINMANPHYYANYKRVGKVVTVSGTIQIKMPNRFER